MALPRRRLPRRRGDIFRNPAEMTDTRGEMMDTRSYEYLRPVIGGRSFRKSVQTNCLINRSAGVDSFVLTYTVMLPPRPRGPFDPAAAAAEQY